MDGASFTSVTDGHLDTGRSTDTVLTETLITQTDYAIQSPGSGSRLTEIFQKKSRTGGITAHRGNM